MSWLRWDDSYLEHPQVEMMDWQGQVYFWVLCMVCKKFNFKGGLVPYQFAEPRYIARRMGAMPVDAMEAGQPQAINVGLIDDDCETGWRIEGWNRFQKDNTSSDRVARYREKKRKSAETGSDVTDVTLQADVTATVRDGTGRNGTEKEKKKGQLTLTPDVPPKPDELQELVDHYNEVMGRSIRPTEGKRKRFNARRKTFSMDDLKQAVRGALIHPSLNQRDGVTYHDFDNVFRNDDRVESLIEAAKGKGNNSKNRPIWERHGITEEEYRERGLPGERIYEV